ncbi:hypothetical protein I0C86_19225 [Plantactinospora sp. S1510]|uniref:Uncharacterized protein n=1 Tax=Plantactinospora alkalitolerans TaxID=2789879 RepID=A0ABS0GXZ5_9ACTN|nr:hypothetical protein [Plantactinospora alkalitolerans]MBF9131074.1 hypothetical protein [Plantactinospora alkalitolerans]
MCDDPVPPVAPGSVGTRRRRLESCRHRLGESLLSAVGAVVAQHALGRPLAATGITICQIGANPVSLGAATFALKQFLAGIGTPSGGLIRRV